MRCVFASVVTSLVIISSLAAPALAQSAEPPAPAAAEAEPIRPATTLAQANRPTASTEGESDLVTRINNWTVGVAGGLLEGTFSRFAAELGKAFDDGENLRVLPVLTYGATENVSDLLYLKGIDIAITHADVFEEFKKQRNIGNIDKRINYISPMFVSEFYLLVRPEIKTIEDLEGKVVSLHTKGAGQTVTGPIVFERLGVNVKTVFVNNTIAFEKMKTGEIAGLVHSGGKPNDFFTKMKAEPGFHFLPIPYSEKFADYYVPSTISYKDYPNLMKEGEEVETIGNQVVLAVYNWPVGTDRHRRLERFVQYFFERFDKLRQAPYHPKWKEINLAGTVPGWTRYPPAERMLNKVMAEAKVKERIATSTTSANAAGAGPDNPHGEVTEEQRLFQEFLDWKKKKPGN